MVKTGIKCNECGNTLWEVASWVNKAYCTNCSASRPFYRRKKGSERTKIQLIAIERIRDYFLERSPTGELAVFEVSDHSEPFLSVRTEGSYLFLSGLFAQIGRRGKITILAVYNYPISAAIANAKHYAKMLGGHSAIYPPRLRR